MTGHLFLFQIGPVQAFIVQARRTQDLYVGSRMLSELAAAGVRAAAALPGHKPVFPMPGPSGALPASVPHRFAFVSSAEPQAGARTVREAVEREWRERFVEPVRRWLRQQIGGGAWESEYDAQANSWLEFNWAAVPYAGAHNAIYGAASAALAARRLSRQFRQPEGSGPVCTLTGAQPALSIDWARLSERMNDPRQIVLRAAERLSAIALIKRFAGRDGADCGLGDAGFPSTDEIAGVPPHDPRDGKQVSGYLAVLHMDGDRMGTRLSQLTTLEAHQQFSRRLAEFADKYVPQIVGRHARARLVYAGGDDVLALVPLASALQLADALRTAFSEVTGGMTASVGVAITPHDLPLDIALETAREAERHAKDDVGRDAIVVTEAHGSGQMRTAEAKWVSSNGVNIAQLMAEMQAHFSARRISGGFAYDVGALAHDLSGGPQGAHGLDSSAWASLRLGQLRRLLSRRLDDDVPESERAGLLALADTLAMLGDSSSWLSLTNWLILARFLAQGSRKEK